MSQNPVRPVAAGAPSHHAHLVAVYEADVNQVINAGHNVVIALAEIIAADLHLELLAVIGRTAVIRQQADVTCARVYVRVVAGSRVEVERRSSGGAAVNLDDQRIAFASLVIDRLTSTPPTILPSDDFHSISSVSPSAMFLICGFESVICFHVARLLIWLSGA